ncbi:MAG: class I SAM-dependent methyltransferase [Myxococcota bacterium]
MLTGVNQTAILTLRARADEHLRPDRLFADPVAAEWMAKLAWPSDLDDWYRDQAQNNVALRVADIDHISARLLNSEGMSSVVELGCGLSTRSHRLGGVDLDWTSVDLPPVVALRKRWNAPGRHIPTSVLDPDWILQLPEGPHLFIAEGLFYYLPRDEVDALIEHLSHRCPDSILLTDMIGATDFEQLNHRTAPLGAPLQWYATPPLNDMVKALSLDAIPDYDPDTLSKQALTRYFSRLEPSIKVLTWWGLNAGELPAQRSGNIVGRLKPHALT